MSYCRHNGTDSEAYVIRHRDGKLECLSCRITGEPAENGLRYGSFVCNTNQQMIDHLGEHVILGWNVPARAFQRLRREINDRL